MPIFRRPRRRLAFRKAQPLPIRYVLLLSLVFFIISTTFGLWVVNKGIKPVLVTYAKTQSVNLATYVMNQAIAEEIDSGLDLSEVIIETETMTTFNTDKINAISTNISDNILAKLKGLEEGKTLDTILTTDGEIENIKVSEDGGIEFEVPLGRLTNNVLLANLGPNIPVRFHAVGEVQHNHEVIVEEQQINRTWIQVNLDIKVGIQVLFPFSSEVTVIERNVPLAMGQLKGDVPLYYGSGGLIFPREGGRD